MNKKLLVMISSVMLSGIMLVGCNLQDDRDRDRDQNRLQTPVRYDRVDDRDMNDDLFDGDLNNDRNGDRELDTNLDEAPGVDKNDNMFRDDESDRNRDPEDIIEDPKDMRDRDNKDE